MNYIFEIYTDTCISMPKCKYILKAKNVRVIKINTECIIIKLLYETLYVNDETYMYFENNCACILPFIRLIIFSRKKNIYLLTSKNVLLQCHCYNL